MGLDLRRSKGDYDVSLTICVNDDPAPRAQAVVFHEENDAA